MTKIAVITKSPSKTNYSKYFPFPFDLYTLTSQDLKKVLVKDVDISINLKDYDYTILVGSEALKYYSKVTSVNDYTGKKVPGGNRAPDYQGFIACINPSVLIFKPEYKDSFDKSIESIVSIVAGIERKVSEVHYVTECDSEAVLEEYLEQRLKEAQAPVNEKLNLAIDTETNSFSYKKGFIIGLCLSHKPNFGMYIESGVISQKSLDLLQEIIDHPNYRIIGHNLKFDMHFLENSFGLNFDKAFSESRAHDTMLIHYTLDERTGTHGLKGLALKYTDMGNYDSELDEWKSAYCKAKGIASEDFTYDLIPWELISYYGCMDSDATIRLFHFMYPKLENNPKLFSVYTNILMPGSKFLCEVEENGVPVSKVRLEAAKQVVMTHISEAYKKLYTFASVREFERVNNKEFNPDSPVQLRQLLFDFEGLSPTGIVTDTGADSTNAEALLLLGEHNPLASVILEIRKYQKLLSTYIKKMEEHLDHDGRLRTGFNLQTTTSGRLSSSGNINLQQLPRDDGLVKGCIQARKGYKIVAVDKLPC